MCYVIVYYMISYRDAVCYSTLCDHIICRDVHDHSLAARRLDGGALPEQQGRTVVRDTSFGFLREVIE